MEKSTSPHWGIDGGQPGLRNFIVVQSQDKGEFEVFKTSGVPLEVGDRVIVTAGGGGGYGDPSEREPEAVRWDVVNGYVSVEHAKEDYKVVIDPVTLNIDTAATEKLRNDHKIAVINQKPQ
jgi:N-methylhydantoinase B